MLSQFFIFAKANIFFLKLAHVYVNICADASVCIHACEGGGRRRMLDICLCLPLPLSSGVIAVLSLA